VREPRCVKVALDTTRQKAIIVVVALNEVSGGGTKIDLLAGFMSDVDPRRTQHLQVWSLQQVTLGQGE